MRKYISNHRSELEERIFPYGIRNGQQSDGSPSSGDGSDKYSYSGSEAKGRGSDWELEEGGLRIIVSDPGQLAVGQRSLIWST